MESVMQQLVGQLPGQTGADTPLARAQALVYQAFEEQDEERRAELAREALALCPDCADAYVLLAEHAPTRKQALELYQQGVAAGQRALGERGFQEAVGHFWGILETRPYMRARLGLAHSLWSQGRQEEAAGHLQDMLRLNPNDNQGARYTLASFLLALDRDEDLAWLLQQYGENSATWAYTRALLAFRQHGDTLEARRLLKTAKKANKHLPPYLLGQKFPPGRSPSAHSPGEQNEALNYLGGFLASWKATPGAVAWLRGSIKAKKAKPDTLPARGPLGIIKKWLNDRLPQEDDVWQADCRQMPKWIRIAGEPVRPWIVLVTSRNRDLVLAHRMPEEAPSEALGWDVLVQAMQHPAMGEPHRPTEVQVLAGEFWESLRPHLEEVGIRLVTAQVLDQFDGVFTDLTEKVCGKVEPGLLDMPGIKPDQAGAFYDAAAYYFRLAPWKKIADNTAIKVACDRFDSGPWYAVLMGQLGLTTGLALYDDLGALRQAWAGGTDEENARHAVGTSVTFGEE